MVLDLPPRLEPPEPETLGDGEDAPGVGAEEGVEALRPSPPAVVVGSKGGRTLPCTNHQLVRDVD